MFYVSFFKRDGTFKVDDPVISYTQYGNGSRPCRLTSDLYWVVCFYHIIVNVEGGQIDAYNVFYDSALFH